MIGTQLGVRAFLERAGQELLRLDPAEVQALADAVYDCYTRGRFVFVIGNGGSGSNASHFCEDLARARCVAKISTTIRRNGSRS